MRGCAAWSSIVLLMREKFMVLEDFASLTWRASRRYFRFLLGDWMKFLGGRGGALGTAFPFYVVGAVGDFVIELLDFQGQVKILGVF